MLILAFKVVLGLNVLGVALVLSVALDVFPLTLPAYWLRVPLAMFLAGMMLSLLGLFWTGAARTASQRKHLLSTVRRGHWLPTAFAAVCHILALMMFCAACWAFLGMTSLSRYHGDTPRGSGYGDVPYFQHP